jgi:hypothetical protein
MRTLRFAAATAAVLLLASCKHTIKVEPVTIEPIHLTVDLNIRVDRKLDEFFAYEGQPSEEPKTDAAPDEEESR